MIKRILQKIKTKKNGEIGEILVRPGERKKKTRLRAFARTRAKNRFHCFGHLSITWYILHHSVVHSKDFPET